MVAAAQLLLGEPPAGAGQAAAAGPAGPVRPAPRAPAGRLRAAAVARVGGGECSGAPRTAKRGAGCRRGSSAAQPRSRLNADDSTGSSAPQEYSKSGRGGASRDPSSSQHRQPSLLRALVAAYGRPYFWLGGLKLCNDILNFAGPLLLNALLRHLGSRGGSSSSSTAPGRQATVLVGKPGTLLGWDVASPLFGYTCAALLAASLALKVSAQLHCTCQCRCTYGRKPARASQPPPAGLPRSERCAAPAGTPKCALYLPAEPGGSAAAGSPDHHSVSQGVVSLPALCPCFPRCARHDSAAQPGASLQACRVKQQVQPCQLQ